MQMHLKTDLDVAMQTGEDRPSIRALSEGTSRNIHYLRLLAESVYMLSRHLLR